MFNVFLQLESNSRSWLFIFHLMGTLLNNLDEQTGSSYFHPHIIPPEVQSTPAFFPHRITFLFSRFIHQNAIRCPERNQQTSGPSRTEGTHRSILLKLRIPGPHFHQCCFNSPTTVYLKRGTVIFFLSTESTQSETETSTHIGIVDEFFIV